MAPTFSRKSTPTPVRTAEDDFSDMLDSDEPEEFAWPDVAEIAEELREINEEAEAEEDSELGGVEVHLQVMDSGSWKLHEGSSQYLTDHDGYFGYGIVPGGGEDFDAEAVAQQMLDEAMEERGMDIAASTKLGRAKMAKKIVEIVKRADARKVAALSRQEAYQLMASPLQDAKALLIVGTNAAGNEDWDYVGYDLKAGDVPVDFLVAYMHRMGGMPGLKKEDLTPHSFVESQTKTLTKVVVSYALGDNRSIDMELRLKKTKAATAKSADLTKALGPLNDAVLKMNKAIEDAIQASMKAEPAEARKMLQTLIAMLDLEIKDYQGVIAETKKQLGTITVPVEASTKQAALSGKDRKRIIEIARSENDPNDLNFKDNADIEEVDEDGFWVEGTKYVWVDRPKDMVEASTKQAASVGSGANGYKGFFQGKEVDVHADTKLQALQLAREYFKAPKSKQHMVHVELAELGGQQVSIKPSTVGSVKAKQAGGLGLSESAIATHLEAMQELLQKGDVRGLKRRTEELAADVARLKGAATKTASLESFFTAYVDAALWSSNDESDDSGGEPLDKNYGPDDIDSDTLAKMKADCKAFMEQNAELLQYVADDQAGHDFWLSRNGHGAGFFDLEPRQLMDGAPENLPDTLQDAARKFGEFYLYIGDDGKIYGS